MPFQSWPSVAYIWKTEEKGSDVNIATYLLLDAFKKVNEAGGALLIIAIPPSRFHGQRSSSGNQLDYSPQ